MGRVQVQAIKSVLTLGSTSPTMSQAAVAGFVVESWYGLMAPVGTPDAAVTTLHREVMAVLAKAEVIKASGARIH